MDEGADEGLRSRLERAGEEALGDLAQYVADNPWLKQALSVAIEARERASVAGQNAIRNVGVPTAADVDRLGRRLRALSERLESLEDAVDRIEARLNEQRGSTSTRGPGPGG